MREREETQDVKKTDEMYRKKRGGWHMGRSGSVSEREKKHKVSKNQMSVRYLGRNGGVKDGRRNTSGEREEELRSPRISEWERRSTRCQKNRCR